jgi:fluoroacetyl-CoA thioesterase
MQDSLKACISLRFDLDKGDAHTFPTIYPKAGSFQVMSSVLATAFLLGFIERDCIETTDPHLDSGEQSVGAHICVSHIAATPIESNVYAHVTLEKVDRRRLFKVEAYDEEGLIGEGTHERAVIDHQRFILRVSAQQAALSA